MYSSAADIIDSSDDMMITEWLCICLLHNITAEHMLGQGAMIRCTSRQPHSCNMFLQAVLQPTQSSIKPVIGLYRRALHSGYHTRNMQKCLFRVSDISVDLRYGVKEPYEKLKAFTRGQTVTEQSMQVSSANLCHNKAEGSACTADHVIQHLCSIVQ